MIESNASLPRRIRTTQTYGGQFGVRAFRIRTKFAFEERDAFSTHLVHNFSLVTDLDSVDRSRP